MSSGGQASGTSATRPRGMGRTVWLPDVPFLWPGWRNLFHPDHRQVWCIQPRRRRGTTVRHCLCLACVSTAFATKTDSAFACGFIVLRDRRLKVLRLQPRQRECQLRRPGCVTRNSNSTCHPSCFARAGVLTLSSGGHRAQRSVVSVQLVSADRRRRCVTQNSTSKYGLTRITQAG